MLDALSGLAQASALDLSQNGVGHFGIPRQHARLNHVSTLMVGRWGFVGVLLHQSKYPIAMTTVKPQRMAKQVTPVTFTLHQSVAGETRKKIAQGYLNNYSQDLVTFQGGVATLQRPTLASRACVVKLVEVRDILQPEQWAPWIAAEDGADAGCAGSLPV